MYEPSIDKDQVGVNLLAKDEAVFNPEAYKAALDATLKNRELEEARAARVQAEKQKDDELAQRALLHKLDAIPNDIWAQKDTQLKADAVNKITDYVYSHPELYDTKGKDRVKSQLELDKLIYAEKAGAMRSNAWQKEYLANDAIYNRAFTDKTDPASPEEMYNYKRHKELGTEATAGVYENVTPHRKANIEKHITKEMQSNFDKEIRNNPNVPITDKRVDAQFMQDITSNPDLSISNADDYDKEDKTTQKKYEDLAVANKTNPLIEYALDKHKETLNYLKGQYLKYAPEKERSAAAGTLTGQPIITNTYKQESLNGVTYDSPELTFSAGKITNPVTLDNGESVVPNAIKLKKLQNGDTRAYATYVDPKFSQEYHEALKPANALYDVNKDLQNQMAGTQGEFKANLQSQINANNIAIDAIEKHVNSTFQSKMKTRQIGKSLTGSEGENAALTTIADAYKINSDDIKEAWDNKAPQKVTGNKVIIKSIGYGKPSSQPNVSQKNVSSQPTKFDYSKAGMEAKAKEMGKSVSDLKALILAKKPNATFE